MTPLERLLAEAIPTGDFGGPRTPAPLAEPVLEPVPDAEGPARLAVLAAALAGHRVGRPAHRHLRAVPDTRKAAS